MKKNEAQEGISKAKAYADIDRFKGAQETSGAIFEITADLTNPIFYGYPNASIPVFKSNNLFMELSKNSYANPATYTNAPLLSGYISKDNYAMIKNSSYVG